MDLQEASKIYHFLIKKFIKEVETSLKEQEPNVSSVAYKPDHTSKGTHAQIQIIFVFNGKKEVAKGDFPYTDIIGTTTETVVNLCLRLVERRVNVLKDSLSEKELDRLDSMIAWSDAA